MQKCKYQINNEYCVEGLPCDKANCEYYAPHNIIWNPQDLLNNLTICEKTLLYNYLIREYASRNT